MAGADAGVDHVGVHALAAGGVGVATVQGQVALVDAVEAPWGVRLGGAQMHDPIGLDVGHAGVGAQGLEGAVVEAGGKALERGGVDVLDLDPGGVHAQGAERRQLARLEGAEDLGPLALLEDHDVLPGDALGGVQTEHRRAGVLRGQPLGPVLADVAAGEE